MNENKFLYLIFILLLLLKVNVYSKVREYKVKVVSIQYPKVVYYDNDKDMVIPISMKFYNKEMKTFFLQRDYPYFLIYEECVGLLGGGFCSYYKGNIGVRSRYYFRIPKKYRFRRNEEKLIEEKNKDKIYEYECRMEWGYGIEIGIYNRKKKVIKRKMKKSLKSKYSYNIYDKIAYIERDSFGNENIMEIPEGYVFLQSMPSIRLNKNEINRLKNKKIEIRVSNPYIEYEVPIIDVANWKKYEKLRFVSDYKGVISIEIKKRDKKEEFEELKDEVIEGELNDSIKRAEREFKGYFDYVDLNCKESKGGKKIFMEGKFRPEYFLMEEEENRYKIKNYLCKEMWIKKEGKEIEYIARAPNIIDFELNGKLIVNNKEIYEFRGFFYNPYGSWTPYMLMDVGCDLHTPFYSLHIYNRDKKIEAKNIKVKAFWEYENYLLTEYVGYSEEEGFVSMKAEELCYPYNIINLNVEFEADELVNAESIKLKVKDFIISVLDFKEDYLGTKRYRIKLIKKTEEK